MLESFDTSGWMLRVSISRIIGVQWILAAWPLANFFIPNARKVENSEWLYIEKLLLTNFIKLLPERVPVKLVLVELTKLHSYCLRFLPRCISFMWRFKAFGRNVAEHPGSVHLIFYVVSREWNQFRSHKYFGSKQHTSVCSSHSCSLRYVFFTDFPQMSKRAPWSLT